MSGRRVLGPSLDEVLPYSLHGCRQCAIKVLQIENAAKVIDSRERSQRRKAQAKPEPSKEEEATRRRQSLLFPGRGKCRDLCVLVGRSYLEPFVSDLSFPEAPDTTAQDGKTPGNALLLLLHAITIDYSRCCTEEKTAGNG